MLREPADASLTICRRQGGSLGQFASIAVLDVLHLRSEQKPRPGQIFQYSLVLVRRRSVRQAQTFFCILVKLAGVHCLPPLDISQLLSSRCLRVSTVLGKYGHIQPQHRENQAKKLRSIASLEASTGLGSPEANPDGRGRQDARAGPECDQGRSRP